MPLPLLGAALGGIGRAVGGVATRGSGHGKIGRGLFRKGANNQKASSGTASDAKRESTKKIDMSKVKMPSVNIKLHGVGDLKSKMMNMSKALEIGPGDVVMMKIGKAVTEDIQARFDTEGYGTWKPLSPLTIKRKGHDKILIDTGIMMGSVGVDKITDKSVRVVVPHATEDRDTKIPQEHQKGVPRKNLPQRKIVEKTPQLIGRIMPIVHEWLKDSWKRS